MTGVVHPHVRGAHLRRRGRRCGRTVHPHVRGAHSSGSQYTGCVNGPSPRAWGSRREEHVRQDQDRSIPTCVGLTLSVFGWKATTSVHPHVRGAHRTGRWSPSSCSGPSPRAWGSLRRTSTSRTNRRSIPTCVGLTPRPAARRELRAVHPHVRGAHSSLPDSAGSNERSIPTCVGLTRAAARWPSWWPVHPHVRGAHPPCEARHRPPLGPSPRAWGSHAHEPPGRGPGRSIPTCVGLTRAVCSTDSGVTVHPHVRGAHRTPFVGWFAITGPSPRAWGSHRARPRRACPRRSIPTCVGLTAGGQRRGLPGAVHPHVRGAHRPGGDAGGW
mgnify:CR=1 FL=1